MGNTNEVKVIMDPMTRTNLIDSSDYNIENAVSSGQATLVKENKWTSYFDMDFYGNIYTDKVCLALGEC